MTSKVLASYSDVNRITTDYDKKKLHNSINVQSPLNVLVCLFGISLNTAVYTPLKSTRKPTKLI